MRIAVFRLRGAPYAKSGGLGDVMEALPAALSRIPGNRSGAGVALLQKKIKENPAYPVRQVAQCTVKLGWRRQYAGGHGPAGPQ